MAKRISGYFKLTYTEAFSLREYLMGHHEDLPFPLYPLVNCLEEYFGKQHDETTTNQTTAEGDASAQASEDTEDATDIGE